MMISNIYRVINNLIEDLVAYNKPEDKLVIREAALEIIFKADSQT